MSQSLFESPELKRLLKEAMVEALEEQRDLLREVFADVLEDLPLAEAIRDGERSDRVRREDIMSALGDPS